MTLEYNDVFLQQLRQKKQLEEALSLLRSCRHYLQTCTIASQKDLGAHAELMCLIKKALEE